MTAYYNEFDPGAAAWLRELINNNMIAPGVVDTRSIVDVRPSDLAGFTQCHFFAGIGGWSLALRMAGVPDTAQLWTGSPPCQPFSKAGQGAGFADERHLWPYLFYLISQCGPRLFFGEQVASKDGLAWLDLVQADMEAEGYAFGAFDMAAAGVGAPHIRQRLWLVGHALGARLEGFGRYVAGAHARRSGDFRENRSAASPGAAMRLADGHGVRLQSITGAKLCADAEHDAQSRGSDGRLADAGRGLYGSQIEAADHGEPQTDRSADQPGGRGGACGELAGRIGPGPTNGFWRDADWLLGRDAKWRPVEPGTFCLADGVPERVGLLRGFGNAISPPVAKIFIEEALGAIFQQQGLNDATIR